jgi:ATPase subunit of ABC transporter with duplicated ATPase domains
MAPPLIQLSDIALTFGGTPLLDGVELSVSAGEKVCLVGRNGSGKSTLLKIAAGLVEPDGGTRFLQPGATVRYLPQEPDLSAHPTTLSYVQAGLGPGDDPYQAKSLLGNSGSTAVKTRRSCRAAKCGARRWPMCWRRRRIFFCSTSRPTISTCRPSNGWKPSWANCAPRWC